ncbi:hypothetical protein TWF730_000719 [Orbilia blumenaviensis]|uniref:Uncharacterized protein n=1 Tax=Orbilia blumenaviensis TaxID=1796055 RepID=A0AAV9VPN5_9PEZI
MTDINESEKTTQTTRLKVQETSLKEAVLMYVTEHMENYIGVAHQSVRQLGAITRTIIVPTGKVPTSKVPVSL